MTGNGKVNKKALRRLYPQGQRGKGPQRQILKTTLPPEVMRQLRSMVVVGKGGEAAPLVTLSIEMMTALLSFDVDKLEESAPRLRLAARKLGSVTDGRDVAMGLRLMANTLDPP
jgi:hypothetical protein